MNEEKRLSVLRQVLAEAIMLGTKLSEKPYGGCFWDPSNRSIWEALDRLHERTAEFLDVSGLSAASVAEVFPVHAEMAKLVEPKS